jgi:hypothetical protein
MRVGLTALPVLVLIGAYFATSSVGGGGLRWEPVQKTVARFVGLAFFRGFAAPTLDFWLALALFAVVLLVLGVAAVRGRWLHAPAPSGRLSRLVLVLAACLALLYVVSPDGVGDAYNLKARFQLVMWAWLLPSLPATRNLRARRFVIAGVTTLLAWQIATFGVRAWRFNAAYDGIVTRATAMLTPGSTFDRVSEYEHETFDGSFIKVLAHAPEDIAYHCRCVLVDGYHPSTAFYWVRRLSGPVGRTGYRLQVRQLPSAPMTVTVTDREGRAEPRQ